MWHCLRMGFMGTFYHKIRKKKRKDRLKNCQGMVSLIQERLEDIFQTKLFHFGQKL